MRFAKGKFTWINTINAKKIKPVPFSQLQATHILLAL
jgi:hypothetical protein